MRLWAELQSQHDPDLVPLLQPLLDLKRSDPSHLVYLPLNSHWNAAGAILLPKLALARLGGPSRYAPEDVQLQTQELPERPRHVRRSPRA